MEQTMHPEALKACREKHHWTQEQLEEKCGFGKGQVSRWERGEIGRVRSLSREKLTKTLGVSWDDLTRPPDRDEALAALDAALGRVQLNVPVNRSDRNALQLVGLRYNLRRRDIIRLAPLLFLIIAEKSLAHRKANNDATWERLDQTESEYRAAAPHLSTDIIRHDYVEKALSSERASIERRDVFGHHVQLENADYDTFAELNTFLDYLKILMADIPPNLVNTTTSEWRGNIHYEVAEETLREVTGIAGETVAEHKIRNAILDGRIDLGAVLSRKKTLSQEEYLSWLSKAIEVAENRGPAIKLEEFNIAKEVVKNILREKGFELADIDTDEIKRLAVNVIADNPDITREAERRVDQRSKMVDESSKMTAADLLSASNGESS